MGFFFKAKQKEEILLTYGFYSYQYVKNKKESIKDVYMDLTIWLKCVYL